MWCNPKTEDAVRALPLPEGVELRFATAAGASDEDRDWAETLVAGSPPARLLDGAALRHVVIPFAGVSAELRARAQFPAVASNRLAVEQAGLALVIDETVADTGNAAIRRVDLAVSDAREPRRVLANITAFVGRP